MLSGLMGFMMLIGAIVTSIDGKSIEAVGFLIATAIFWTSWNIAVVGNRLNDILKEYKEKVLADKTVAAIMKKVNDDGK